MSRARSSLMRQLSEQELDTQVAYVASKSGKLIPKSTKASADNSQTRLEVKSEVASEDSKDYVVPDGAVRVRDSGSQVFDEATKEEPKVEEVKAAPKKRPPPPRKKKTEATA